MGKPAVVATALLQCSFGAAPAPLQVLPINRVTIEGRPAANVLDGKPVVNVPSFGLCSSMANPTVAAATAANLGVLTPMPCMPATAAWVGGATRTTIGGAPALAAGAQSVCSFGGVVQVVNPGSTRTLEG